MRVRESLASWDTPVCVDLLTGTVSEAQRTRAGIEVPMADYPMILTDKRVLALADEPQQPSYEELIGKLRWTY